MNFLKLFVLLAVSSCLLLAPLAEAQNGKGKGKGSLRSAEVRGNYRAEIFTAPAEIADTFESLMPRAMLYQPVKTDQKKLPLLISLHGSGGGQRDIEKKGKWTGTIRSLLDPENQKFQCLLLVPQSKGTWHPASLEKMLTVVLKAHPEVDTNRIYCIGYSMGGKGTWEWAMHQPDRFAAIMPKGFIPDLSKAEEMVELPIWAMVGDKDSKARVEGIPAMEKKLKELGSTQVKITVFPGENHSSTPGAVKKLEGLYEWMFSHSKK